MSSERRATIRDLAQHLGLSKSTVSAALRGSPTVKAVTRARVEHAAAELGYRPHPHFRILGSQRARPKASKRGRMGFLLHSRHRRDQLRFGPAEMEANRLGYEVDHIAVDDYADPDTLAAVLQHSGIDALYLVTGCAFPFADFPWHHFAVVSSGLHHGPAPVDRVEYDAFRSVMLVWERVVAAGWRRIGAYLPYEGLPLAPLEEERLAAVHLCQERDLEPAERIPPLQAPFQSPARFQEWFQHHQPEALIGLTCEPLSDRRFLPPGTPRPPFASIQVATPSTGTAPFAGSVVFGPSLQEQAMQWLDQKLRLGQFGLSRPQRCLVLEPEWVEGASLWSAAATGS